MTTHNGRKVLQAASDDVRQGSGGRTDSAAPYDRTDSSGRLASNKVGGERPEVKRRRRAPWC
jgi:hypothetical protein